ncbi:MAG: CbiM family transporter [Gemmataceae bacterium]|nr:CbiM family transporter [Gemmataceae bacterium]
MLVAVHISDGILTAPWWLGGYVAAAGLVALSSWRVRDEEIPRIALLTATLFVVSLIHVRVGFTSVHLLFNGLLGVVLGLRTALAVAGALFLQYCLVGHGGIQTLGINTCVLTAPALLAWLVHRAGRSLAWIQLPWARSIVVAVGVFAWVVGTVLSVSLLLEHTSLSSEPIRLREAWQRACHPLSLSGAAAAALATAWCAHRLAKDAEFALGLTLGAGTVLATVALNCAVLLLGGEQHWPAPPLFLVVAHLPIALIEGIIMGFTLAFLTRVKPELVGAAPRRGDDLPVTDAPLER